MNDPSSASRTAQIAAALRDAISSRGVLRWSLVGDSMFPTLRPGNEIEIVAVGEKGVRVGEVVVFVQRGSLVVHRLVRTRGDLWLTQGDGCAVPDPLIPPAHQVGRVRAAVSNDVQVWPSRLEWLLRYRWHARYQWLRVQRRLGRTMGR